MPSKMVCLRTPELVYLGIKDAARLISQTISLKANWRTIFRFFWGLRAKHWAAGISEANNVET